MKKFLSKTLLLLIFGIVIYVGIQIYQEWQIKDYSASETEEQLEKISKD